MENPFKYLFDSKYHKLDDRQKVKLRILDNQIDFWSNQKYYCNNPQAESRLQELLYERSVFFIEKDLKKIQEKKAKKKKHIQLKIDSNNKSDSLNNNNNERIDKLANEIELLRKKNDSQHKENLRFNNKKLIISSILTVMIFILSYVLTGTISIKVSVIASLVATAFVLMIGAD